MFVLYAIFLFIDILIAFYLYRQAFIQRSNRNKKYKTWFAVLLALMAGSVAVQGFNLPLACLLAGIPACLATLLSLGLAVALSRHKGPWN